MVFIDPSARTNKIVNPITLYSAFSGANFIIPAWPLVLPSICSIKEMANQRQLAPLTYNILCKSLYR